MEQRAGSDDPEVFDFLDEFHRDRDAGRERTLVFYLKRFPGHEESIAREYVRLTRSEPAAVEVDAPRDERRIGPYKLLRELGHGGQGMVWLAEDTRIARQVAIKCLPSSFAFLSSERRRRFQREAEVVSRLEHPSICPVYEAQIEHDPPYIAMRLVDGETLAAAISRARSGKSDANASLPLPPKDSLELRRVLSFFERSARALHAAHEAGVIHRDIKPGNVMVAKDGEPVLLDFGQARDEHAELGERTLSGEVLGTPAYMSPEQVLGSASALDRRTDVWSLGASLFEALTLKRPFEGDSVAALMHSIRTVPLPNARALNAAIGDELEVVLETALEKDVARRYPTALALAEDLRRIREYEPILARPAGTMLKLQRWTQRHPAVAILIVSLALGLAWTLHLLRNERAAREGEHEAKERANSNLELANRNLDHALGRHLAERATDLLGVDPSASLAIGLHAVELAPCYQTRAALLASLDACRLATLLDAEESPTLPTTQKSLLILDFAITSDSQRVVAALEDASLCVWNLRSGEALLRAEMPPGAAKQVLLLPGDERFVTSSNDSKLRIWSLDGGGLEREIECGLADILSIDLDAEGRRVAALARGGALEVRELESGRLLAATSLDDSAVARIEFSDDGSWLLVSSVRRPKPQPQLANAAFLIDAATAAPLGALSHEGLTWAEFSHDSQRALTAGRDGTVRVWRVPEGTLEADPLEHGAPVTCARFTPDGKRIVSGTDHLERSAVTVWELSTREPRLLPGARRRGIVSVAVSPDGGRIVAASSDPQVNEWTIDGVALMSSSMASPPLEAIWTADGQRFLTLGRSQYIHVFWGEDPPDLYTLHGDGSAVTKVAFEPDGRSALTVSESGVVRVWHTPASVADRGERAPGSLLAELHCDRAHYTQAMFLPGERVLALSKEGIVTEWQWARGERCDLFQVDGAVRDGEVSPSGNEALVVSSSGRVFLGPLHCESESALLDSNATCARFLGDTGRIVVGGKDGSARVYERDGTAVSAHPFRSEDATVTEPAVKALAVLGDGREFAAGCNDRRVRFFAAGQQEPIRAALPVFDMQDLAYNRAGNRLLVTGPIGKAAIRLQNLPEKQLVRTEVNHAGYLTSGAFDRSGELVLTTSEDGTVLIRSAENGTPIAQLVGHTGAVLCAAFDHGSIGTRVISGSTDGTARVWPVDPEPAARARKPRELRQLEHEREARLAEPLKYH